MRRESVTDQLQNVFLQLRTLSPRQTDPISCLRTHPVQPLPMLHLLLWDLGHQVCLLLLVVLEVYLACLPLLYHLRGVCHLHYRLDPLEHILYQTCPLHLLLEVWVEA